MDSRPEDFSFAEHPIRIRGWGIDADLGNDPTRPMRHRLRDPQTRRWSRPTQQPHDKAVEHSLERPSVSAVFGTSLRPAGLSGTIRRLAFRRSEDAYGHWVLLLLADRVNAIEGVLCDLLRGRLPNPVKEMGLQADWRHDRTNLLLKTGLGLLAVAAVVGCLRGNRNSD